ncbi:MAG TPA: SufD family Fe-S cluster assembly protein [Steroidobacteraceae bacterium]|nr:SufD family Fe-S cluster assembly protein [Steroidobacteraceae bacterium]HRX89782.1 SufD family Fe-S cluster assembly protein [Steroidobacteraceae bacterium]
MSNGSTDLIARLQSEHAAAAGGLPQTVPVEVRRQALEQLAAAGLPNNRDENWRYANLRALKSVRFAAPNTTAAVAPGDLPAPLDGFQRFVFVDGLLAVGLSAPLDGAVRSSASASGADRDAAAGREARFALLSDVFAVDGLVIGLDAASARRQIEVLCVATADGSEGSSYPRLAVQLAAGARLQLVERHVSVGSAAAMVNSVADIQLAPGAVCDHVRVQQLGARCTALDTLDARVAADAQYRLHSIANGAAAARSTLQIRLEGQRARLELTVGTVAAGNQTLDTYAMVDHAATGATTRELFRGIAADRSRIGFNGKMIVRDNARGADSQQMLKGLLAGSDAEINVRPQLEIYTDEVRAAHGATTGKLDENMLFYLLSRGIEPEIAQSLLKWAFIEDALVGIQPEALRRSLELQLARQFQDIAALDGLLGSHA